MGLIYATSTGMDHNTHIVSSRNIVTSKNIYQLLQTEQSISFHRRQETILV